MRTIIITAIAAMLASCETKAPTTEPEAAMQPRSAELRTPDAPPPPAEPVKVWICCPAGGGPCYDVDSDVTQCKAPDKLIYCCGPITTPNGVTCGC